MLIYFYQGKLPWKDDQDYKTILYKKEKSPMNKLCPCCPKEFELYMDYCKKLTFEQDPDYDYLKGLLKTVYTRDGYEYDNKYDWDLIDDNGKPRE